MRWRQLLGGVLALLLLWQIAAWLIHNPILPPPWTVLQTFGEELTQGSLLRHVAVSAWRIVASTVAALILAVPAGLVLGQSAQLDRLLAPLIYLTYPIPKVVLLPIFLLLFGTGNLSKIVLIATILFFQILVVVRDEARGASRSFATSMRPPRCRRC